MINVFNEWNVFYCIFGSTDQKNKSSLAGGKTKFLDFFFIGGIRNKMLGKVKNFQGWVAFRFY